MMPSRYAEPRTAASRREFLALVVLADALLIAHMARAPWIGAIMALAALAVWMATRTDGARVATPGNAEYALRTAAAGGLGMLLGLVVDAGPLGVLALISICNANHAAMPGLDAVSRHLYFMPTASIGMVAGCVLLTLPTARAAARAGRAAVACGEHAVVTLGMLCGMLSAEALSQNVFAASNGPLPVAATLSSMLVGMYAGTLATAILTRRLATALRLDWNGTRASR